MMIVAAHKPELLPPGMPSIEDMKKEGIVMIDGAPWKARVNRTTPIAKGAPVRVVAIEGLYLEIEPEEGGARDYREMRPSKDEGPDGADEGPDGADEGPDGIVP